MENRVTGTKAKNGNFAHQAEEIGEQAMQQLDALARAGGRDRRARRLVRQGAPRHVAVDRGSGRLSHRPHRAVVTLFPGERTMDFNKRDILSALGLETENNFWTVALAGFGVGCLVGAAVAIMVTPKSGRELRTRPHGQGARPHGPRQGRDAGHEGQAPVDADATNGSALTVASARSRRGDRLIGRLIFLISCCAYGDSARLPSNTDRAAARPCARRRTRAAWPSRAARADARARARCRTSCRATPASPAAAACGAP